MSFPKLYAIADAGALRGRGVPLEQYLQELRAAGVELLQYRDKDAEPQEVLRCAALIRDAMDGSGCRLILNDRADLAVLAGWDGVHVGQGDLLPEDARRVVGVRSHPSQGREGWGTRAFGGVALGDEAMWVGVSTHTEEQVRVADASGADYVAVGPVFATGTKLDAEPVVGLAGVRWARALTTKPLVAIGGITRENARSMIDAGADSVAVIGGLLVPGEPVEKVVRDFLERLG